MTTQTASLDMTAALGGNSRRLVAGATRGMHLVGGLAAHGAAGVVGWLRAGQLGGGSVELARWAGARR